MTLLVGTCVACVARYYICLMKLLLIVIRTRRRARSGEATTSRCPYKRRLNYTRFSRSNVKTHARRRKSPRDC